MKYHKLKARETTGTYVMESPVTEADILQMAQQLAMSRLSKGWALTEPKLVLSHLQTLLQYHEFEVFALLLLDTKHRVIGFRGLFRGTLDGASVYPRGPACDSGQQLYAQNTGHQAMVGEAPALQTALHTDQCFVARRRRTLVRAAGKAGTVSRCFRQRGRTESGYSSIHRGPQ